MKLVPQTYTIASISKLLDIPTNTLRTWEQFLQGVLTIPRDQKGNRYYTDVELDIIKAVKAMRDIGISFEVIRDKLASGELEVAVTSDIQRTSREEIVSKQFFDELATHIRNQVTSELRAELEQAYSKIAQLEKEIEATRNLIGSTSEDIKQQVTSTSEQIESIRREAVATSNNMDNHMKTIAEKFEAMITESRAERILREETEKQKGFFTRLFGR